MYESLILPCSVLVADPAWRFGDKLPGEGRGAVKHYSTMSHYDIARFPLPPFQKDAILFLWRVSAMPEEALMVARVWDFTPKSELVWVKKTKNGKRHIGMGRYVRAEHETCLIATRGRFKVADKGVRSVFEAAVGEHSEKPDEFFQLVEKLIDGAAGSRVELFARKHRPGWDCFGDELETKISPDKATSEAVRAVYGGYARSVRFE